MVQTKKQMEPDKARTYDWLVDRIFKEEKVIVSNNAAKEVLTYIGQCKNGFYQRTITMTVRVPANTTRVRIIPIV